MLLALRPERRGRHIYYWFRCDCGHEKAICKSHVTSGKQMSCGCYGKTKKKTHGRAGTPEYKAWHALLGRCEDQEHRQYPDYGGRGIKVCERWHEFENFLADMGERPSSSLSIDRINNDGNYEPGNCRWATRKQQSNNRRPQRSKRLITYMGRSLTQAQWAEELGLTRPNLCYRLKRLPLEQALRPGQYRPWDLRKVRCGVPGKKA